MNKKADGGLTIIAIIVLSLVILTAFLVSIATRECNSNRDCPANAYCGTDYECHEYPEDIVVNRYEYVWAAIIFGICIIIAAYVYKTGHFPKIKLPKIPKEEHGHDDDHHH